MNQLNQNAYFLLLNAISETTKTVRSIDDIHWYELTYKLFTNTPLESIDDFWRIVAYTYSWMPTIPDVRSHLIKEPDLLLQSLRALKNGDDSQLLQLFTTLIPVINNSLVGVSKVLHFIAPKYVPIIDRNVLNGWDFFFFQRYTKYTVPKLPTYATSLNHKHIQKYLDYRATLLQWADNCSPDITLRDLESAFFELGKNTIMHKIYHPTIDL